MAHFLELVDEAYGKLKGDDLEEQLLKIAEDCEKEYGKKSRENAAMICELATFYRGQYRLYEAEDKYKEAYNILVEIGEGETANAATLLNNLGTTYRYLKFDLQATEYYEKAMEIYEKVLGKDHIYYASALNNLSITYAQRADYDKSIELLQQAAEILKKYPEAYEELATAYCNTGGLLLQKGELENALSQLLAALELYENEIGTYNPHYHVTLQSLGFCYRGLGNTQASVDAFKKAAEACKNIFGTDHPEYKAICKNLNIVTKALKQEEKENKNLLN